MGELLFDVQGAPATPAAGQLFGFFDSTIKRWVQRDENGLYRVLGGINNASIASQGAGFASDTYVTNSDLQIPSFGLQAGMRLRWELHASKTAAGTATPVYTIRQGANRTTADTSRLAITGPAQTAAADDAVIVVMAVLRSIGASGVLQGVAYMAHNLAATGFANNAAAIVAATSSGFDTSGAGGQYFGLTINGGASAAWTITQVQAFLDYL